MLDYYVRNAVFADDFFYEFKIKNIDVAKPAITQFINNRVWSGVSIVGFNG